MEIGSGEVKKEEAARSSTRSTGGQNSRLESVDLFESIDSNLCTLFCRTGHCLCKAQPRKAGVATPVVEPDLLGCLHQFQDCSSLSSQAPRAGCSATSPLHGAKIPAEGGRSNNRVDPAESSHSSLRNASSLILQLEYQTAKIQIITTTAQQNNYSMPNTIHSMTVVVTTIP